MKTKLLLLSLLLAASATAQTSYEEIQANPERSAGIYFSYPVHSSDPVAAPKGFKPFYISHFGRHGSRWHTTEEVYTMPLETLRKAAAADLLTAKGREVLRRVEILSDDARDRSGELTPRGVEEHRGIAERMYASYPEVFSTRGGRECRIESRSTIVPRCILSMAAFDERLKELDPKLHITRESSMRHMPYMACVPSLKATRKPMGHVMDSLANATLQPERLMRTLFTDPSQVKAGVPLMAELFALASIAQDVSYLDISLYDIFTEEEIYALWKCENVKRYLGMGPSMRFGDPILSDARGLLRNIVETADSVLAGKCDLSASLRFGHDSGLVPLLSLIGVERSSARVWPTDELGKVWSIDRVSPMAANLQLIFFRNKNQEVRVRVMHNERDAQLPIPGDPFYEWTALRAYLVSKL